MSENDSELEPLLDYLKRTRGFDFTAYKRTSLGRRIRKRMQTIGIPQYSDYVDYLEVHPEEFPQLFNTILINVTSFFRDLASWEYVGREIVPLIAGPNGPDGAIRVWSAGTASGQEAYSAAILFAERLGVEAYRKRVKIYATDVDEDTLNQARQATYRVHEVEDLPPDILNKYFERTTTQYVFNKELRRSVIFGRHDLVQDAPISRIDLLICRNTLMYFNSETQGRVLSRFHFALKDGGYLFLGRAEMMLTHGNVFTPVDLKSRVFNKTPHHDARGRLLRAVGAAAREEAGGTTTMGNDSRLHELSFDVNPVAEIVVDGSGMVALINERARALFTLAPEDLGRPLRDLAISYRPTDLRSAIDEAVAERHSIVRRDVAWTGAGSDTRYLDIHLLPLFEPEGELHGVKITFMEMTRYRQLQDELQQSKLALETAYEELQSSNEELETTNEELQSSNEELETTNEELQSTNEELETMNEELQSTNEELETINTELRERTEELNDVNAFLSSILGGIRAGVAVLDQDLRVLVWNDRAADLWGLRADEVDGRNFLNLDIGLPVAQLRSVIRGCLSGESRGQQTVLDAVNRRGRTIKCAVSCSPLYNAAGSNVRGAILLMDPADQAGSP
jgi:two-component system CheB/CheR fusion protein